MEDRLTQITKDIAEKFDKITYVEIGVAEGTTLTAIASILQHVGKPWKAVGIELPNGYSFNRDLVEQTSVLRGLSLNFVVPNTNTQHPPWFAVTVYLKDSQSFLTELWQEPIHLALIDGCHGKPCVTLDFIALEAWMEPGGCVLFHDVSPEQQGIFQPHCSQGIHVRDAINQLGLFSGRRKGWRFSEQITADRTQDGWDMAVFHKELAL
jgi:hypothetical protein